MIVLDSSVCGPVLSFTLKTSYLFRPLFFYYVRLYLSLCLTFTAAVYYVQVYPTNHYS